MPTGQAQCGKGAQFHFCLPATSWVMEGGLPFLIKAHWHCCLPSLPHWHFLKIKLGICKKKKSESFSKRWRWDPIFKCNYNSESQCLSDILFPGAEARGWTVHRIREQDWAGIPVRDPLWIWTVQEICGCGVTLASPVAQVHTAAMTAGCVGRRQKVTQIAVGRGSVMPLFLSLCMWYHSPISLRKSVHRKWDRARIPKGCRPVEVARQFLSPCIPLQDTSANSKKYGGKWGC